MNYAPQIINYLSSSTDIFEVFLAPNAYPLKRKDGKLIKLLDTILTSEDIRDTIVALRSYVPTFLGPLGKEGSFSFSLHKVGRFRVVYMTQRGSYVISIIKTPFDIPTLEELCEDPSRVIKEINRIFGDLTSGLVLITGKNLIKVSTFSYSLLQYVCINFTKVILVLEKPLNYLLKHGNSLVIQREIGVDVESIEEGLKDGMLINPDVLYLGFKEFFDRGEINQIIKILEMGTLVILSLPWISEENVFIDFGDLRPFLRKILALELVEDKDILRVSFREIQPLESGNR